MKTLRIIPRLEVKGPNIVKGMHMEGLRIVGEPASIAHTYYEEGADEIFYTDIVASLYGRSIDFDIVRAVAQGIFVPLTVGGGIRSVEDIDACLHAGADKIAINTHAIQTPDLIDRAAQKFGSQCVVLYVEAKRQSDGTWEAYVNGGRERSGREVLSWICEGVRRGAGEILLSSVDRDGIGVGFDLALLRAVRAEVAVPIVVHGGARGADDMADAFREGADAAAAASCFHYRKHTIRDIKQALHDKQFAIRL